MKTCMRSIIICLIIIILTGITLLAEDYLVLHGLLEDEVIVSLSDIKELPQVTKDVISVNSLGHQDHFTVTGCLFNDLLA